MKKLSLISIFILTSFISLSAQSNSNNEGIVFKFNQIKGASSSYISTVEEDAYFNGVLNNHAEIINRISTVIEDVDDEGTAKLKTRYMTTNNTLLSNTRRSLSWGEENNIEVTRKSNGELVIDKDAFMPTVRNVPIFPSVPRKTGQSWTGKGEEVHDVRQLFNMKTPIIIPFVATYKYEKDVEIDGTVFNVIEIYYEFFQQNTAANIRAGSLYASTVGYSKQTLFWDNKKGILDHYNEEFKIQMQDVYNNQYLFTGTAHSEITEFINVSNDNTLKEIQDTVDNLNLNNISVKKGEHGLTISIENIQFEPDSNVLLESEKEKIKVIASILTQFPNDLLITGHCADRGTFQARQVLSEERAESVAQYLQELGVRDEYHIFTQGKGSTEPIATNNTEEGRSKNRRVEITIMDK